MAAPMITKGGVLTVTGPFVVNGTAKNVSLNGTAVHLWLKLTVSPSVNLLWCHLDPLLAPPPDYLPLTLTDLVLLCFTTMLLILMLVPMLPEDPPGLMLSPVPRCPQSDLLKLNLAAVYPKNQSATDGSKSKRGWC